MAFRQNDVLHLPDLAANLGLTSPDFRVEEILRGGMGECLRVTQSEASWALKVIQTDLAVDPDAWNRYLRELRLWTTLSGCTGVVEAFCIIRVNDLPVVCSRWMRGGSLRQHLRNQSPELFYSAIARVVGTLGWAYDQHRILHRDLKPDNILLDEGGRAYVSDWGLARPLVMTEAEDHPSVAVMSDAPPALTVAGSFLGTVYYASPEQLLGDPGLDHRSDIYSLGCMMYEWDTGSWPFSGSNAEEVQLKHLFQAPAPLGGRLRKSAFGADEVILTCLEKDPAKRFSDYASLDSALSDAARGRGIRYSAFRPSLRYKMPMVGAGEFGRRMKPSQTVAWNKEGTYAVVEQEEIEEYLQEAQALSAIGDHRKAVEIYGSLFVPEVVTAVPDHPRNQRVAINYADCLIALGRTSEAIAALRCLAAATTKPAEYFVNLSLAQLKCHEYALAAMTAHEGLQVYRGDQDLVGNLLIAQTAIGEFAQAAETAKSRLQVKRDVHSLHEVAVLYCKYAGSIREREWPLAVKNLRYAVDLLREARLLNPRYLPVRIQLPIALEAVTAFTQCSDEIADTKDLSMHLSDRIFLASLVARCLDGMGAHKECWEFCDRWLKHIADIEHSNSVPRHSIVSIERVRAVTITDGYCIGKMKDGQRVIAPVAAKFFAHIVRDTELRRPDDFCYLARLHEWMEEYERAYAVLGDGESLFPEHWEFAFNRAAFRVRAGDYPGALQPAELATESAPWKPQAWRLLAKALDGAGRTSESSRATIRAEEVHRVRTEIAAEIDRL